MLNAFTVDLEDYYHVTAFERHVRRHQWAAFDSRIVGSTHKLLRLLDRFQVPATFFALGWVARRNPVLIREIKNAGHELASHSYWHRQIFDLHPDEFRSDLQLSRAVIEDILGEPIWAYRAPTFSITRQSLWALDILSEEGFSADSSIFPIYHDRYGIPDAQEKLHQISTDGGPLWEFPLAVMRCGWMNIPVSGGGYFRLYPIKWTMKALARLNRRLGQAFVFYVHPWELDPDQPRLSGGTFLCRRRHYVNLASTERKLEVLLRNFRFGRFCDVIEETKRRMGAGAVHNPPSAVETPLESDAILG